MIKIFRNVGGLQSIADEWMELAAAFDTPLLGYEWFDACAEAFCAPGQLNIVAVVSGGSLKAAAPLAKVSYRGVDRLQLLTAPTGEPGGFLYADEASLQVLIDALLFAGHPLILARLPHASAEVRLLSANPIRRGLRVTRNFDTSPWLPIDGTSWERYEASLSSSRRSVFRRARKRAEAIGPMAVDILCPACEAVEHYLDQFSRIEATSWKAATGGNLASKARLRRFFANYLQAAARRGTLRMAYLSIAGKPVAGMLALVHARRFWILKIAYDPAVAACSPGTLLIHETIRHAFQEKLEAYEFLGFDEPWLHAWTDHLHPYVSPKLYPYSVRGLAACGIDAYCSGIGRVRRLLATS